MDLDTGCPFKLLSRLYRVFFQTAQVKEHFEILQCGGDKAGIYIVRSTTICICQLCHPTLEHFEMLPEHFKMLQSGGDKAGIYIVRSKSWVIA